ncbi:hypothetical protein AB0A63_24635 [Lentzea sp. NPDC042327]|uniref:hypothetical protein n=1 Tax=Lentzea sp. NPDC042327 TaxID=3154801 RepID=UPI0033E55701
MVLSFTANAGGLWAIPLVVLGIAAFFGYVWSLASYRPNGGRWVVVPAMALFFASLVLGNIGGHSLWLSAFGETVRCNVVEVQSHKHTRSPTTYSNTLDCGGRQLSYRPTTGHEVADVGARLSVVVDRTGFVSNLEAAKVNLGHSLLFPLGLLVNAAFIAFVARRPVREP